MLEWDTVDTIRYGDDIVKSRTSNRIADEASDPTTERPGGTVAKSSFTGDEPVFDEVNSKLGGQRTILISNRVGRVLITDQDISTVALPGISPKL
ncbi:MAG: hypothetical protein CL912_31135 [Deltaproteobacteria bacterium]|nr:hypothetical protein [Deltaproteobacteria bacterium]